MGSMTVRITRRVVEYVDIEIGFDVGEEADAIAECEDLLAAGDEISGWDYLTPPIETCQILYATLGDLGLSDEMNLALTNAGIETPRELKDLGFDAACQIPDTWRSGLKAAFAKLEPLDVG